jgi:predicted TIM-barrel fold metal-dependent hydrolase
VRGLDFLPVDRDTAGTLYAKQFSGAALNPAEEKAVEDYLFNDIAARAGALGLVVHIHTGNVNGPYFNNSRANPGLLEPAIDSEPLHHTNFVLLHGGWPFYLIAEAMMDRPNVYGDFSAQTFYLTPHALAQVLRAWLDWHPEKVLFGSDAYSDTNTPLSDYEEKHWLTTWKARKALRIALTAMMRDGEITRSRAIQIAHMALHNNAAGLYGIR